MWPDGAAARGWQAPARLTLQVATKARALRPGEVVLVTVTPSRTIESLDGRAFGADVAFWQDEGSPGWRGLFGIPLETRSGSHTVTIEATAADGATAASRRAIRVAPGKFATRRLRVDPRFVDPPASAVDRITRDARTLADLFAARRPGRLWSGPFVAPVPGASTSSFGRLTILNGKRRSRHMGADFRAAEGAPIQAPNAGEIVLAEDLYFSGLTVVLDHGEGLVSLFAHLSRAEVAPGARVARGDRLGEAGSTGRVTGPHLHWAVRLGNVSVDPLSLLSALDAP